MGDTLLIQQRGFRFDAASKTINGALEFMQIRDGTRSLYFAEPLIRSHSPIWDRDRNSSFYNFVYAVVCCSCFLDLEKERVGFELGRDTFESFEQLLLLLNISDLDWKGKR